MVLSAHQNCPLNDEDKATVLKVYDEFLDVGILQEGEISLESLYNWVLNYAMSGQISEAFVVDMIFEMVNISEISLSNIVIIEQGSVGRPDNIKKSVADILQLMGYHPKADDVRFDLVESKEHDCCVTINLDGQVHKYETVYKSNFVGKELIQFLDNLKPVDSEKSLYYFMSNNYAVATFISFDASQQLGSLPYDPNLMDDKLERHVNLVTH